MIVSLRKGFNRISVGLEVRRLICLAVALVATEDNLRLVSRIPSRMRQMPRPGTANNFLEGVVRRLPFENFATFAIVCDQTRRITSAPRFALYFDRRARYFARAINYFQD